MSRAWQHPVPLTGLALALLAAGQISLAHLRNGLSQEISQARQQRQALQTELNQLRLELASLTRPDRLRQLAGTRLGMGPAAARQIIRP